MIIAVEGPDGAGKTTFVAELKRKLEKAEILHFGPPKQWAVSEYELPFQTYRAGAGEHIICDRLYLGELIYGPLYRGKSELDGAGAIHVSAWLKRLGAVLVVMDAPDDVLIERVMNRGDDYINVTDIPTIAEAYRRLRGKSGLAELVNPTADVAIALARAEERSASTISALSSYIGDPRPDIVFVGDRKAAQAGEHVQAFVPFPGRSGAYLMNAITQAGIKYWGVMNAFDEDLSAANYLLGAPTIIALGAQAVLALNKAAVKMRGSLPHPAWANRFGTPVETYAAGLWDAIEGEHLTSEAFA